MGFLAFKTQSDVDQIRTLLETRFTTCVQVYDADCKTTTPKESCPKMPSRTLSHLGSLNRQDFRLALPQRTPLCSPQFPHRASRNSSSNVADYNRSNLSPGDSGSPLTHSLALLGSRRRLQGRKQRSGRSHEDHQGAHDLCHRGGLSSRPLRPFGRSSRLASLTAQHEFSAQRTAIGWRWGSLADIPW